MTTFLAHLFSIAGVALIGYLFFYRPVSKMLRESEKKMEERVEEVERLTAKLADAEARIDRDVRQAGETLDRLRTAAIDLARQEIRKSVEREARAVETEKPLIEKELAKIL